VGNLSCTHVRPKHSDFLLLCPPCAFAWFSLKPPELSLKPPQRIPTPPQPSHLVEGQRNLVHQVGPAPLEAGVGQRLEDEHHGSRLLLGRLVAFPGRREGGREHKRSSAMHGHRLHRDGRRRSALEPAQEGLPPHPLAMHSTAQTPTAHPSNTKRVPLGSPA
jgi:hypothetical protein